MPALRRLPSVAAAEGLGAAVNDRSAEAAAAPEGPVLARTLPKRTLDYPAAFRWVQARHGWSRAGLAADLARLCLMRRFEPMEYFIYGLYRRELTRADRRAYLSQHESTALNAALNPPSARTLNRLIEDKLLCGLLLERLGVPAPVTRAHVSTHFRLAAPATLVTRAELAEAFAAPGMLPAFGKPVHASRALGALILRSFDPADGLLTLGDGRRVPAAALAEEMLSAYPDGYLLQELLENAPDLARAVGPTLATVRIVTVQSAGGPRLLYAVLRLPAPNAMHDGVLGGRTMAALVDTDSGRILRVQDMFRLAGTEIGHHPGTGATLPGLELPGWAEGCAAVLRGHRAFADHGLLGWDVALTARGPVVNEVNCNPLHILYQRAAGSGLLDDRLGPLVEAARAVVAARTTAPGGFRRGRRR